MEGRYLSSSPRELSATAPKARIEAPRISVLTVHEYLTRAEAAGVGWPIPAEWNDTQVQTALFPVTASPARSGKDALDCAQIQRQLRDNRHVTLQLLWQEYREANPNGYRYSRYCEIFQSWRKKQNVVMRQHHTPGEKAFIDWAGATFPINDRHSNAVSPDFSRRSGKRPRFVA